VSDTSTVAAPPTSSVVRKANRAAAMQRFAFPAALGALVLYGLIALPQFRTVATARNILAFSAILFIMALGQTLVVISRGVDLSVGSMAGLSGAVFAIFISNDWSLGVNAPIVGAIAALGLAALIGAGFNGVLTAKAHISFLIVTLGSFSILRSQVNVLLDGRSRTVSVHTLNTIVNGRVWGIPNVVLIAGGIYLVVVVLLRATVFGRALYVVGSNPQAARVAGIPIDRVVIIAFGLSAVLAATSGILIVGQLGSAQVSAGSGMELTAIAAVLLGGTRFSGGYGSATHTLLGVLFLGTLNSVLILAGVSTFWQGTASGLVLIGAVAIDRTREE
jgi:ribose/xylose/arabinose/galactoside ABC-type transport system permease subunit